ncbi:beta-1,3-galactosyltransferase 1-like [Diadema antillarum]|uniref:beta-1,3-galactosyltransferase 1-like n=1 Tax=Diadema antillarum TaxID=105358 RepID=UPI003A83FC9E
MLARRRAWRLVCVLGLVVGIIVASWYTYSLVNGWYSDPTKFLDVVATNRHEFELEINEPSACQNEDGTAKEVFLLVLVHSAPKNFALRSLVRDTWGGVRAVDGKRIVTLFLLGKTSDAILQRRVERESEEHRDLLKENFVDSYKHLTLKTIMGMKWAGNFCAHAGYVMKTDDDMFVGYESIVRYLSNPEVPAENFMMGLVIRSKPHRDPESKWYIPESLYPDRSYPPFCSGSGYILSGDLPSKIYETSLVTPYLPLEDVYIGICVRKLGVMPVRHKEFNNYPVAYSFCRYKSIFTTHLSSMSMTEKRQIWEDFTSTQERSCLLFNIMHTLFLLFV